MAERPGLENLGSRKTHAGSNPAFSAKMKLLKSTLAFVSPVADILGILGFFGLSIKNFNLVDNAWYVYLILMFSLIIFWRLILKNLKEIRQIYVNTKIDIEFEKISSQANIKKIQKSLPSTEALHFLYERALTKIHNWADDALVFDFALYLDYADSSWTKPQIQVMAYSNWKKEEGWFYEGSFSSEDFYEVEKNHHEALAKSDLFFKVNKSWQQIVKKAFDAVNNKLTNECKIRIDKDSIWISFHEGKVKKTKMFTVKNNFTELIPR